jgi:RNA polymerase subunit RPABC4/transcription elongation factor Spt4
VAPVSDEQIEDIAMAECGACQSIIPLDSESCPNCGIRFGGVSEEQLGECGACGELQPVDSTSCSKCGVSFVGEEAAGEEPLSEPEMESELSEIEDVAEEEPVVEEEPVSEPDLFEDLQEEVDEDTDEEIEEEVTEEVTEDVSDVESESDEEDYLEETEVEQESDTVHVMEEEVHEESEEDDEESEEDVEDDSDEDSEENSAEASDDESDIQEDDEVESDEVISDEEEQKNLEYWRSTVVMAFENLALAIAEAGMTASEAFVAVDGNDDNLIDAPELQKGIEKISGEWLTATQVKAILEYLDTNDNNRVDPNELVEALDNLKIGIKPGKFPKQKKVKEFPSNLQKFLMGKTANDIFYPVAYFLMVTMIGLFIANGFGIPGASGEGGNIVYEGDGDNWNHCGTEIGDSLGDTCSGYVNDGETYPCEASIDPNECRNSITIFSGESSDGTLNSMPKGFYLDGIMFIILGTIGLAATAYLHMVYAPSLRKRAKGEDNSVEETSEPEEEPEEEDEGVLEAPKDLEIESQYDDEDESEEDDSEEDDESEDEDESEEDDDEDDDDIDIGDWVGIDIDGEEFFGEIIEFDDDEGTVTIETEDGDEVTGDQDDMFLEDDDDE